MKKDSFLAIFVALLFQDIDLENNKEFQKLKFAAPGPKMYDSKHIKTEPGRPIFS